MFSAHPINGLPRAKEHPGHPYPSAPTPVDPHESALSLLNAAIGDVSMTIQRGLQAAISIEERVFGAVSAWSGPEPANSRDGQLGGAIDHAEQVNRMAEQLVQRIELLARRLT